MWILCSIVKEHSLFLTGLKFRIHLTVGLSLKNTLAWPSNLVSSCLMDCSVGACQVLCCILLHHRGAVCLHMHGVPKLAWCNVPKFAQRMPSVPEIAPKPTRMGETSFPGDFKNGKGGDVILIATVEVVSSRGDRSLGEDEKCLMRDGIMQNNL